MTWSPYENPYGADLLLWREVIPAFLVDMERVNLDDLINAWSRPGAIIRVEGMDGPPVVPLMPGPEKWYPIEDEI